LKRGLYKKTIKGLLFALVLSMLFSMAVQAGFSDSQYTYKKSRTENVAVIPTTPVFDFEKNVTGDNLRISPFSSPRDVYCRNEKTYILDSGNSRVVVLDENDRFLKEYSDFSFEGRKSSLKNAGGIFVDSRENIYIADTENSRVVIVNGEGVVVNVLTLPENDLIRENAEFLPVRVCADEAGNIYVISRGTYEGIFQFEADGSFNGFTGAAPVKYNLWDLFWKRVMPKAAQSAMVLFVPTEYLSMDIDGDGFLYSTSGGFEWEKYQQSISENGFVSMLAKTVNYPIKRLSPNGIDVLRRRGAAPPVGSVPMAKEGSPSVFIDVAVSDFGLYSVLDSEENKVYTYDDEGYMLVCFGAFGAGEGMFGKASSLAWCGDRLMVVDQAANNVCVFKLTDFGRKIVSANAEYGKGNYTAAKEAYQDILQSNVYYEMAYTGLGKTALREKEYKEALRFFKLANDGERYSEAMSKYRQHIVERYFVYVVLLLVAVVLLLVFSLRGLGKHGKKGGKSVSVQLCYGFHCMLHPFDAFWDMRFANRASVVSAGILYSVFFVVMMTVKQYTGFVFTTFEISALHFWGDIALVMGGIALIVTANCMASVFMGGMARFKDVFISFAYSLMPMILILPVRMGLSYFFMLDEKLIYSLLFTVAIVYTLFMVFCYNAVYFERAGRALFAMVLTVVCALILLFVILLFFTMLRQILGFVLSVYYEFLSRAY